MFLFGFSIQNWFKLVRHHSKLKNSCRDVGKILPDSTVNLKTFSSNMTGVDENKLDIVKKSIQRFPNFPKPGIVFVDIFSVLRNPKAFCALQGLLTDHVKSLENVDVIVALDSRGFLFGPTLALEFGLPFVPIRKKGKLPGKVNQVSFTLEYGSDDFEIQTESILPGQNVLLLDDLLATGGSLQASCQLISQLGAKVVECLVIVELTDLKGREKIPARVHSLIQETERG